MPRRGFGGGRRSGGGGLFGRSKPTRTRTRKKPQQKAPPPATQTSSKPNPMGNATSGSRGSSGILGGLGSTLMQGLAFGTGSAIAHRAIDGVAGPRTVQHEWVDGEEGKAPMQQQQQQQQQMPQVGMNPCMDATQQFAECIQANQGNVGACNFFYDQLQQCQVQNKDYFAAQNH